MICPLGELATEILKHRLSERKTFQSIVIVMGDCGIISTGWAERFSLNSYCIGTSFVMNGSLLTSYGRMRLYFNLVRTTQVARKIASIPSLAGDIFLAVAAFPTSGGFGKMLPHLTFDRRWHVCDLWFVRLRLRIGIWQGTSPCGNEWEGPAWNHVHDRNPGKVALMFRRAYRKTQHEMLQIEIHITLSNDTYTPNYRSRS